MVRLLSGVWALLLGIVFIMLGNGMHFTLIGLRGGIEGFSAGELAIVTSGYFMGFLSGARFAPVLIRRVGHVRVFAALGSFMSAGLIALTLLAEPWAWTILRVILGFCMSGIYVAAESWLNNAATSETRGKVLSAYMIAQTLGITGAQGLLTLGDAGTAALFIGASILVSISFAPILLSISPTPAFESTKRMTLRELYGVSPLGMVGIFLLGSVFAAQFGMAAVYATEAGMRLGQISIFVAAFYVGALFMQYPLGWISDRVDRRGLIMIVAALGAAGAIVAVMAESYWVIVGCAAVIGGCSNPLYSLLIAYTNDFLESEDMAAASAGLLFINGVGAIAGPLVIGWVMQVMGPPGFFVLIAALLVALTAYAAYRMTQRPAPAVETTGAYAPVLPSASPVAMEVAQEYFIERSEEDEE